MKYVGENRAAHVHHNIQSGQQMETEIDTLLRATKPVCTFNPHVHALGTVLPGWLIWSVSGHKHKPTSQVQAHKQPCASTPVLTKPDDSWWSLQRQWREWTHSKLYFNKLSPKQYATSKKKKKKIIHWTKYERYVHSQVSLSSVYSAFVSWFSYRKTCRLYGSSVIMYG